MTSQSGGTVSGYPGVASDGASGLVLDGGIQTDGGLPAYAPGDGTPFNGLAGYNALVETPENVTNQWDILDVYQSAALTRNSGINAVFISRSGTLNGHDYTSAVLKISDSTAGTGVPFQTSHSLGLGFTVGKLGGIGAFGATPPAAQPTPTIATSTITDAVAKAAIKALITIINNCGLAAITET